MGTTRLNHAVLYVRDAARSAEFYQRLLGMEVANRYGDQAVFLRAEGSANDHHLGLFSVGDAQPSPAGRGAVGLYHLAWEVETLGELAQLRERLLDAGALVGESDHGASKSLYCHDPDGIEFEVMWQVPAELYDPEKDPIGTRGLDLTSELTRYGATTAARTH